MSKERLVNALSRHFAHCPSYHEFGMLLLAPSSEKYSRMFGQHSLLIGSEILLTMIFEKKCHVGAGTCSKCETPACVQHRPASWPTSGNEYREETRISLHGMITKSFYRWSDIGGWTKTHKQTIKSRKNKTVALTIWAATRDCFNHYEAHAAHENCFAISLRSKLKQSDKKLLCIKIICILVKKSMYGVSYFSVWRRLAHSAHVFFDFLFKTCQL